MSKTTETNIPLINPDAYPQMIEMMEDTVRRNIETIDEAERLLRLVEDSELACELADKGMSADVLGQALRMLINEKESGIEDAENGIKELERIS